MSARAFVDTPLYENLIEGARDERLQKLQKFFKNRHWIMMHKGIEFVLVRDEKKKLQAFCFLVPMDKQFSGFDIWWHFIIKQLAFITTGDIKRFLEFAGNFFPLEQRAIEKSGISR